jgi:hypothetical protein
VGKEMRLQPEYTDGKKLRRFFDVPNILPVRPKEGVDMEFFNELDW